MEKHVNSQKLMFMFQLSYQSSPMPNFCTFDSTLLKQCVCVGVYMTTLAWEVAYARFQPSFVRTQL